MAACSSTYGAVEPAQPAKARPAKVEPKPLDLSNTGRPEPLAHPFELKGYETVWLKGTPLLVTLKSTKWDVIGDDDSPDSREGRATLIFEQTGTKESRTIVEGQTKTIMGYDVTVSLAYEYYRESDARYLPHCKLEVRRK